MSSPFLKSFIYAARGIAVTFREGRNFKVMVGMAIVAVALGLMLAITPLEWAAVVICMGCVLGGECINTAIEATVDLVTQKRHPLAGRAKDCAAGGVLIMSIGSMGVAAFIFLPKIVALIA